MDRLESEARQREDVPSTPHHVDAAPTSARRGELRGLSYEAGAQALAPAGAAPKASVQRKAAPTLEAGPVTQTGATPEAAAQTGATPEAAAQTGATPEAATQTGATPTSDDTTATEPKGATEAEASDQQPGGPQAKPSSAADDKAPGDKGAADDKAPGGEGADQATPEQGPGDAPAEGEQAAESGGDAAPTTEGAGSEATAGTEGASAKDGAAPEASAEKPADGATPEAGGGETPAPVEAAVAAGAPAELTKPPEAAPAPEAARPAEIPAAARFAPKSVPQVMVAPPDALGAHQVDQVLGPDPTNGNMFFAGKVNAGAPGQQIPPALVAGQLQAQADEANGAIAGWIDEQRGKASGLEAAKQEARAPIDGAVAQAEAQVTAGLGQARGAVQSQFGSALQAVRQEAAAAAAKAEADYTAAVGRVDAALATAQQQIFDISLRQKQAALAKRTTFVGRAQAAVGDACNSAKAIARRFGHKARAEAGARRKSYLASKSKAKDSSWYNGADYERNKWQARADAATSVGNGYFDGFEKGGRDVAGDIRKSIGDITKGGNEIILGTVKHISDGSAAARKGLVKQAQGAKKGLAQLRAASVEAINTARSAAERELRAARATALGNLDTQADAMKARARQSGESLSAGLENGWNMLQQGVTERIAGIAGLSGENPPDVEALRTMLDGERVGLEGAIAAGRQGLEQQRSEGLNDLLATGTEAAGALTQAATLATSPVAGALQTFRAAIAQARQGSASGSAKAAAGFERAAQGSVRGFKSTTTDALKRLDGDLASTIAGARRALAAAMPKIEAEFQKNLAKLGSTISQEAEKAAAKVKPAWRSIASFLFKILIAILVTILTVLSGGLVGAIVIGILGAAASYAIGDCLIGGDEFSFTTLAIEMVKGGLSGALGFGGGKLIQNTWPLAGRVLANFAVNYATTAASGLVQVGADIFVLGKSSAAAWDSFAGSMKQNLGPNVVLAFVGSYRIDAPGMTPGTTWSSKFSNYRADMGAPGMIGTTVGSLVTPFVPGALNDGMPNRGDRDDMQTSGRDAALGKGDDKKGGKKKA